MPFTSALLLTLSLISAGLLQSYETQLKQRRAEYADLIRQLHRSTVEYKESLDALLVHYEAEVSRAKERADKTKQLYEANLIRVVIYLTDHGFDAILTAWKPRRHFNRPSSSSLTSTTARTT